MSRTCDDSVFMVLVPVVSSYCVISYVCVRACVTFNVLAALAAVFLCACMLDTVTVLGIARFFRLVYVRVCSVLFGLENGGVIADYIKYICCVFSVSIPPPPAQPFHVVFASAREFLRCSSCWDVSPGCCLCVFRGFSSAVDGVDLCSNRRAEEAT